MRPAHTRLLGDILEGAVAVVAIQIVTRAFQSTWSALHWHVVILTSLLRSKGWQIVQMKIDVVRDEQIGESIAVVVSKGGAGRPTVVSAQAGLFGDIRKRAVAIIAIENDPTEACHQQIRASVVVIVADS